MMSGPTSAFENPRYSCAIGLVKYAQATNVGVRRPGGLFSRLVHKLPFFGLW